MDKPCGSTAGLFNIKLLDQTSAEIGQSNSSGSKTQIGRNICAGAKRRLPESRLESVLLRGRSGGSEAARKDKRP